MAKECVEQTFTKLQPDLSTLAASDFYECCFEACNFQDADLSRRSFIDCRFDKTNLSVAQVVNATFRGCQFTHCKLVGINWASTKRFEGNGFVDSVLNSSIMMNQDLRNSTFSGCQLYEVDFSEANLSKVALTDCRLDGAIFRSTNLNMADLTSAVNYFIDPTNNNVKKAKFRLPEAVSLLGGLGILLVD